MADQTKELTAKERRFVELFVLYNDVRKAAEEAGFSKTVASTKAYMWVSDSKTKPHVYEAVQIARAALSKRTEISQERILKEYARIGFSDVRKVLSPGGHLMNPQDWDDDTAAAVAAVEVVTRRVGYGEEAEVEYVHKIKTWDKKGALDSMARHLGMFEGKPPADPGDDQPGIMDDRAAARRVAHMLLRAANTPVMLPEDTKITG